MKRENSQADLAKVMQIKAIKRGKIVDVSQPEGVRYVTQWEAEAGVFRVWYEGEWIDVACPELRIYPGLVQHFVDAFEAVYRASTLYSLQCLIRNVRAGFIRFLAFKGVPSSVSFEDINPQMIGQFKNYLDSANARTILAAKKNHPESNTLSVQTRASYANSLVRCLQYISQDSFTGLQKHLPTFENILHYRNAHKKKVGIQRMDFPQYLELVNAIQVEIRNQVDSYFEGQEMLAVGRDQLSRLKPRQGNDRNPYRWDKATFLAKVEQIINDEGFVDVFRLRQLTYDKASSFDAYRYFAPYHSDLAAHLLNFGVMTAANLTPLLNLKFHDITTHSRLGTIGYKIWLYKARAASGGGDGNQAIGVSAGPSLEEYRADPSLKAGLRVSLEFLELWTRPLRKIHANMNQNVFMGLKRNGGCSVLGGSNSSAIMLLVNKFCDRNSLERINFQSIRPTILDEIEGRFSDYRVTQEIAHHATPDTTEKHYLKGYSRQSYRGRIAHRMEQRSRFHANDGKSDPRLLQGQDHVAATPGFGCIDPYSSPVVGESSGRLCAAYGHCPACPLATADIEDPVSVALYKALNDALYRGSERMQARSYFDKFGEAHQVLQAYLGQVRPEVAAVADTFSFHLPAAE
ncbi:phage integrase SAM-like domain-containing protein [Kordiimonas lacus]|uniref:Integrase n=1 Tax=Kordiimonas lacus TaxID=637679 RepID=A0A1G7E1M9_9PROT|nr:hypothetical protein [Kordiimonas lacus]SDE57386.1 hypothetical protein SAMN04488071_3236 [Kordiimonas lacus]